MMTTEMPMSERRWRVETDYGGERAAIWYIEELSELQYLIEHGPNWDLIERITITLNRD